MRSRTFLRKATMKLIYTSLLLSANLILSHAEEFVAPFLLGYNVAAPIISQYDTSKYEPVDFGLSLSIYKIERGKHIAFFKPGITGGFETNRYTGRIYAGFNCLLFGYMYKDFFYIPVITGVSTKFVLEASKYNHYVMDAGIDLGIWTNLGIIGQLSVSERLMVENMTSTRIEIGHRIPIFGERKRQKLPR
jgi:hypothetical protein